IPYEPVIGIEVLVKGAKVVRRKIQQFFPFKRGGINTVENLFDVSRILGQDFCQTRDKILSLLHITRFHHYDNLLDPHDRVRVLPIELQIALVRRDEIVPAVDKTEMTDRIESRQSSKEQTQE